MTTTSEITDGEITLLEELEKKATPSPWKERAQEECKDWHEIMSPDSFGMDIGRIAPWSGHVEANAMLIVKMRNLLPRLLQAYKEQKKSTNLFFKEMKYREEEIQRLTGYALEQVSKLSQKDQEVEKYKKALEFYSEGKHYGPLKEVSGSCYPFPIYSLKSANLLDDGKIAREALK